ncbi:sulfurtransferase [Thiotrichales bacterium 19S3-7]|nr:sulfurtransferase [Thiotrichales bacterium 19S3-7]MCF6801707.1 sulfurtransferase [Thiotrichales bacterium 19S3-11]
MKHSNEFLALVDDALTRVDTCELEEVKTIIDQGQEAVILIDVRDFEEYNQGFIPGAMHLSRGMLEVKIIQTIPNKNADIILYCGGGNRSALAADNLNKMGYQKVRSMNRGYKGWIKEGFSIVREDK